MNEEAGQEFDRLFQEQMERSKNILGETEKTFLKETWPMLKEIYKAGYLAKGNSLQRKLEEANEMIKVLESKRDKALEFIKELRLRIELFENTPWFNAPDKHLK